KVEDKAGDPVRFLPPFFQQDGQDVSVNFRSLNAGKKSIGLDLKNPEGKETLLRLVERADVLLDGFRPGVLDRLGIGWSVCRGRKRRPLFTSLPGHRRAGPP